MTTTFSPQETTSTTIPHLQLSRSEYLSFVNARLSIHALERSEDRSIHINTINSIRKKSLTTAIVFEDREHRGLFLHAGRLNYWGDTARVIVTVGGEDRYFPMETHHIQGPILRRLVTAEMTEGHEQIFVQLSEDENPILIAAKAGNDLLRKYIVFPVFDRLDKPPLVFVVDSSCSTIITAFFHDPSHPHSPPILRDLPLTAHDWSRSINRVPLTEHMLEAQHQRLNIASGSNIDFTEEKETQLILRLEATASDSLGNCITNGFGNNLIPSSGHADRTLSKSEARKLKKKKPEEN
jgi:hypothetical protein